VVLEPRQMFPRVSTCFLYKTRSAVLLSQSLPLASSTRSTDLIQGHIKTLALSSRRRRGRSTDMLTLPPQEAVWEILRTRVCFKRGCIRMPAELGRGCSRVRTKVGTITPTPCTVEVTPDGSMLFSSTIFFFGHGFVLIVASSLLSPL
jgi:hypothetical protein